MANMQLVVFPLLITIAFLLMALLFFAWLKIRSKKKGRSIPGQKMASVFGYSLLVFGGFSFFIALFFLITG